MKIKQCKHEQRNELGLIEYTKLASRVGYNKMNMVQTTEHENHLIIYKMMFTTPR